MNYALIDMGSNSIRLTVYDLDQTGFRVLFKEKIMAGLAGYVEQGRLNQEGIDCACRSLREFQASLALLQIENLAVFATASLRNVSNTDQAVAQIRQTTGITVEVLTGEQEAEFGFYGAICDTETADGLFADIGGASVELGLFTNRKLQEAGSIPIGSLKLYRDCVKRILPGKDSRRRIKDTIQSAFADSPVADLPPKEHLICAGGTARASLRLCRRLFDLPDTCRTVTREQLEALAERLCKADDAAAELILRYEPERIHTLIPGLLILRHLVRQYKVSDITVSQCGVREGYLCRNMLSAPERFFLGFTKI